MADEAVRTKNGRALEIFKIAGIQIRLDYSWLIVFVLVIWSLSVGYFPRYYPDQSTTVYWLAGLVAALFFFASILVHELSHSFMAMRSGIKIPAITLFVFGGMAHIAEEPKTPKIEFSMAIVGPLTSLLLSGFFWGLKLLFEDSIPTMAVIVLEYLAWINLALGIFNLFPGFPLDGGRVFRALWWWKTGSLTRATKVASDMGKGLAVTLIILGALQIVAGGLLGGLWFIFIGMFLRGMAAGGYQELILRQSLEAVHAREIMVHDVVSVPPDLPLSRVITDYFLRFGYRGFPVAQNNHVVGVISLADVKKVPEEERASIKAEEVMIPRGGNIEIAPEASLAEALKKMNQEQVGRLLVIENHEMIGMITRTGLLRHLEFTQALQKTKADTEVTEQENWR
jgi:Zn-dependent protease/predicted transcriptional regulator